MTNIELETMSSVKSAMHKYTDGKPNWEQRRYEIAKEMMPTLYKESINLMQKLAEQGKELSMPFPQYVAENCVVFADALIGELKTKNE